MYMPICHAPMRLCRPPFKALQQTCLPTLPSPHPDNANVMTSDLYYLQVVVVLSGSMEPGFYRGDILFLNMGYAPIRTGEIVVFNIDGRDIPIVHRVIKIHDRDSGGDVDILTKVRFRDRRSEFCSSFGSLHDLPSSSLSSSSS